MGKPTIPETSFYEPNNPAGVANKQIGRPRVPAGQKRFSQSVTLDPPSWKKVDKIAQDHGVTRSQIVDDAIKLYVGELEDTLRHLREELASQEANAGLLAALNRQQAEELERLKASQQMVGNILSPYGGPTDALTKEQRERSRTLRAILKNPNNIYELSMLQSKKLAQPSYPIMGEALRAWGSWDALMLGVQEAQSAEQGENNV